MKKLGFGLMRLPQTDDNPENIDQEQLNQMVDIYMENGYNYFDTAYPYHNGLSETALKKAVVDRYPRESFKIADKLPIFFIHEEKDMQPYFEEQLERCGVEYFDYYMLHNVCSWNEYAFTKVDSFGFLKQKKKEGLVKQIGISLHDEPKYLEKILEQHPEIDFVQLQINYLDWEDKAIQAKKCYEIARKYNKPIIVMEPIRGGGLAKIPEEAEKLMKEYNPETKPSSWALRFCAGLQDVVMVLCGMNNIEQMKENIESMNDYQPINKEEQEILEKVADIIHSAIEIPCTSCNYCLETCPQNIYISKYFELYNAEKQTKWQGFSQQVNLYLTYIEKNYGRARDCVECDVCIHQCPQRLDIPGYMKKVSEEFDDAADATNEIFS
ncbi:MAG: aldo/keto reductase [Methanosphaera sp.]|nr:aldo/keto reductase [Methanosphaera sp.]